MSKKKVLQALDHVRRGDVHEAMRELESVDAGFVRRRLAHYRDQPDHREAATVLTEHFEEYVAVSRAAKVGRLPTAAAAFDAPLASATVDSAPAESVDFAHPESFLAWVSADWTLVPEFRLGDLQRLTSGRSWRWQRYAW